MSLIYLSNTVLEQKSKRNDVSIAIIKQNVERTVDFVKRLQILINRSK